MDYPGWWWGPGHPGLSGWKCLLSGFWWMVIQTRWWPEAELSSRNRRRVENKPGSWEFRFEPCYNNEGKRSPLVIVFRWVENFVEKFFFAERIVPKMMDWKLEKVSRDKANIGYWHRSNSFANPLWECRIVVVSCSKCQIKGIIFYYVTKIIENNWNAELFEIKRNIMTRFFYHVRGCLTVQLNLAENDSW